MLISPLFGVVAPELGWVPPPRFLLRRSRVLRLLSAPKLGRVVEVGCGSGSILHELALRSDDAVGIETSERARALATAIGHTGNGKQRIVQAPDTEWRQDRDLVCAFDVLEHIEHDDDAIEEWSGWLAAGGRLCVSVPAHRSRWGAGDEWAGHWRRYDRGDIETLLRSRGFAITHIECYGFPLGNLTEWLGEPYYRRVMRERRGMIDKAEATSDSGIDRDYYLRKFRWLDSMAGRAMFRAANAMQAAACRSDWGTGYLVLATKA